jgi:hypothetical protein
MTALATIKLLGSVAGIISAVGSLATVAGVVVALRRVQAIHVIVNSANTELRKEVKTLLRALVASGTSIPNTPGDEPPN